MPGDGRQGADDLPDLSPTAKAGVVNSMAAEVANYLGEDVTKVLVKLEREIFNKGITVAEAWQQANPSTNEEVAAFYRDTDAYIYDLLVDHAGSFRRTVRERVICRLLEREVRTVLDYGGGIGNDAAAMAEAGLDVTLFEPGAVTAGFARSRFLRRGTGVKVVNSVSSLPDDSFDGAVCIEVLEHVVDPNAVIADLRRSVRVGGPVLVTESFSAIGDDYPSHLPTNARFRGKIFAMMEEEGLVLVRRWPDNKPIEFAKVVGRAAVVKSRWRRRGLLLQYILGRGWRALRQVR